MATKYLTLAAGGLAYALSYDDTAYGARSFTTAAIGVGETEITSLPYTISSPGYYRMMSDLSCDASGIAIMSNDVTLDLNGHTLTYGNGVTNNTCATYAGSKTGNYGHMGIVSCDDPGYTNDFSFGWNRAHTGVTIKNGTVSSGSGSGLAFSPNLHLWGLQSAEVYDLILNQATDDGGCVWTGKYTDLHHCTMNSTDNYVTDRHLIQCVVRSSLDNGSSEVSYCHINGGAQVGIRSDGVSHVHHNWIQQNSYATNGYSIVTNGMTPGSVVEYNRCEPVSGRGIFCAETVTGCEIRYNTVDCQEIKSQIPEDATYCHGLKFDRKEDDSGGATGCWVHHNTITCNTSTGLEATALNIDPWAGATNIIEDNTFIANDTLGNYASAMFVYAGNGTGMTIRRNIFRSNDTLIKIDYPCSNITVNDCDFQGLAGVSALLSTVSYYTSSAGTAHITIDADCTYTGIAKTDLVWPSGSAGNTGDVTVTFTGDKEYFFDHTDKSVTETPL